MKSARRNHSLLLVGQDLGASILASLQVFVALAATLAMLTLALRIPRLLASESSPAT